MSGARSANSSFSKSMDEAADVLDRGIDAALVAAGIVAAIAYGLLLLAAFTGLNLGDESGRGGDIIVLPAQPM